jgi:ABC-type Fe3+ transport system substrate-binding protein
LAKGSNIDTAISQGLPVRQLFSQKEGGDMGAGSHHLSFFKDAPHPNAARVYINWALSREGQLTWQNITKTNSLRTDIPKDMVPPEVIPKEGKKYLMTSDPEYDDIMPLRKLVAQVLGRARQR